jgi:hypothetical protein
MDQEDTERQQKMWNAYREAAIENKEYFEPYITNSSVRAYEYGILSIKSVLYLNGGGLVVLPTFFTVIGQNGDVISDVARAFLSGLILSIAAVYLTHINWSQNFQLFENQKVKREMDIEDVYLGRYLDRGVSYAEMCRRVSNNSRWIKITFIGPHVLGILSLLAFIYGSFNAIGIANAGE